MAVTMDVLDSSDYTGDERPQAEVFAAVTNSCSLRVLNIAAIGMLRQVTGVSFVLSLASVLASLILFIQVPTFERLAFTLFLLFVPGSRAKPNVVVFSMLTLL